MGVDADGAPERGLEVLERRRARLGHELRLWKDLVEVDLERTTDVGIDEHLPECRDRLQEAVVASVGAVHAEHLAQPGPPGLRHQRRMRRQVAIGCRTQDLVDQACRVVLGEHEHVEMAERSRGGQLGLEIAPGDGMQPGMCDRDG